MLGSAAAVAGVRHAATTAASAQTGHDRRAAVRVALVDTVAASFHVGPASVAPWGPARRRASHDPAPATGILYGRASSRARAAPIIGPMGRPLTPRLAALAAGLAALALAGAAHASDEPAAAIPPGPVRWVVGADDPASASQLEDALTAAGASVERLPRLDALAVTGGDRAEVVDALTDEGGLDYVERDLPRTLHAEPADAIDPATGRAFGWAWGAVRAGEGIAAAGGGAPSSPVAVVDSGVDAGHPDLAGRVMPGRDVLGAGTTQDVLGHGTFVAGLVSAIDGNGIGGRGAAGATPIIPVRVTTSGSITSRDLAAGTVPRRDPAGGNGAAVDGRGRVVKVSLGGPGIPQVEEAALDYARRRDVLVVASAGNSGQAGNDVEYPAAAVGGDDGGWSSGLSVAATDPLGRAAPFSSFNRHVSLATPGSGI